jgi:beta-lactamase regulating signal transducer with metallopeptidase domain
MNMSVRMLLEVVLKSSAVLVLAWAATRLCGRWMSAAARHQVWAAALLVTLLMPALMLYGPVWNVPFGSSAWADRATALWSRSNARLGTADVWPRFVSPASHAPVSTAADGSIVPAPARAVAQTGTPTRSALPTLLAAIVVVWLAGTLLGLIRLLTGMRSANAVVRRAVRVSSDWVPPVEEVQRLLGCRRAIRVLSSAHTAVPVVCGIVRPALLLPIEADAWDGRRRRAVLCHELAHIARHDCLFRTVAHLVRALYWFNPLAVAAVASLHAEQERACDDVVITAGTPALEYVDHLYAIVRESQPRIAYGGATVAFAERSRLHGRIEAILDETRHRSRPSRTFVSAVAVAAGAAVALGAARPAQVVTASALLPSMAYGAVGRFAPPVDTPPLPARRDAVPAAGANGATAAPSSLVARSGAERDFIASYCVSCHSPRTRTANIDLEQFGIDRVADDPELAERFVRKVRTGLHPAHGLPRPDRASADVVSRMIENVLDSGDAANWSPARVEQLSDRELAARLSRFLWSGEPDAALLALAAGGKLRDPRTLHLQVERMLKDKRSDAFILAFFDRWLSLDHLNSLKMDPTAYPQFDDALRSAFRKEIDLFLASQVREDHRVADLLTASESFVDDRLAQHYRLADRPGDQFRRVTLADQARFGLLGKGAILAVTSYSTRTSPVVRGKWVLETLLGAQAPPPPPNVPALKNGTDLGSMRQRMEAHARNPVCASCHATMDGPGFALENFDAIGRWRSVDGGAVIDASVQMPDGTLVNGPAGLRDWLVERQDVFVATATLKLLSHALDRSAKLGDMPTVRTIVRDGSTTNYRWSSIIEGIVRSQPFRTRPVARETTP